MGHTQIIAAMGYSGIYPENTLLAYRKAIEAGAEGIEVDAHLTKDGVIVLSHDDDIGRTTDGTGKIRDFTYEELRSFNAAHAFREEAEPGTVPQLFVSKPRPGERAEAIGFQEIPKLADLFGLVGNQAVRVIVEMKGTRASNPDMGRLVAEMIVEYGMQEHAVISSFDHEYVHDLSAAYPALAFAAITTADRLYDPGAYAKRTGARQIHPYSTAVTPEMVRSCHEHGVEVVVWSVGETDEEAEMRQMIEMGVDGVMTHYPNRFYPMRRP
ncbi:glycerophosphodiester phosphodiesterase family protein [Cohnella ginsengisoli]|uniref:Glycerophosphodiester phosphodiesterase family protein n=1 Tax=Cohnella ginsengisoli TaxID=425004 RepID=A0A9X4KLI3_9BACL|nr:glycerophosphodiester phosphodiesterase family protein [Cohnella ginsengisoli]MDG0792617.1 glycerophosphodiester phosphodiesterase family protein [Cohnella ginsengisoli]